MDQACWERGGEINNEGVRGIFAAEREEMACSVANCAGTVTETVIPPAKCLNFNYCFPPSERSESDEAALLRQKLLACETANGALPSTRICLALSLDQLPLGAARRCPASSPPSPRSRERRRRRRSCVRSPHGRAACPRSSDCPIILRSPLFALSLDELPLRAARCNSVSSPPTLSPGSRERRRRRARLPLLTCCSPRATVRWFAKQLRRPRRSFTTTRAVRRAPSTVCATAICDCGRCVLRKWRDLPILASKRTVLRVSFRSET